MLVRVEATSRRLDTDELDRFVGLEGMKDSHRVRPASHTRDDGARKPADGTHHLLARFLSDNGLEFTHHSRIRRRPDDGPDDVVAVVDVRDPVPYGFTRRVLESSRSRGDRNHLGAEESHAMDVESLPPNVLLSHVHRAVEAESRAYRGRRDAVLSRSRFRDDATLAHPYCKQRLSHRVVDLVSAGVIEVFALQVDLSTHLLRESRRIAQW